MNRKNLKSFLFIFAFFLPASLFAKVYIPEQTAWVMDSANIIDKNTKSELNSYLESVNRQTGVQIAVFTVKSLEKVAGTDATIEEYATDVFEKWGLGQKKEDNGVLLLVCLDEKKVRIEVGYGLEGVLTDTKCGLIIRNFIAPDFKNASYSEGIKTGVNLIAGYATGNEEIKNKVDSSEEDDDDIFPALIPFAIWVLFLIFVISRSVIDSKNGRNRRPPTGGFFIGGGGGFGGHGGFGGGGGVGGGGGGRSGGGGASGGW